MDAKPRHLRGGLFDSMADIVQFQVEKDFFAGAAEFVHQSKAAAIGEFHADLEEFDAVAQAFNHSSCSGEVWEIERDNEFVAGLVVHVRRPDLEVAILLESTRRKAKPNIRNGGSWR